MKKAVKKFDARPKLNGSWKFLDDYSYENMIFGQLFYSTCHHGIIKNIIFPKNFDLNEFTIISAKNILGKNIVPEPVCDQPFMAEKEVMHFGQIILGIAHSDKKTLRDFVENIKVKYEKLSAIIDPKECLDNERNHFGKEILINHSNNEKNTGNYHKNIYYTQHQEQAYLEPQGAIAIYDETKKTMFVRVTAQCPFFVKSGVETIMGNAINEAIIETSEGIGGAFGGKEDFPNLLAGITSLLAYKSGKPVKIVLTRNDDIQITTKRHPSRIEIETWTNPLTQKIEKCNIDYRLDAGAFQTLSPVVMARGVLHVGGSYAIPNIKIRGRLFKSNTPSNGAFRGFGVPQALAAMEAHIDQIAIDLKIDPYLFRKVNLFKIGDEFPTTQKITENNLIDCLERVIKNSNYLSKKKEFAEWNKDNSNKKGIGISVGFHGGGFTGNGEKVLKSELKIIIEKNANVKIFVANTDMGQGAHTTLSQMFYETINHPKEKCRVQLPNTSKTPNSGPTVASRTIYIIGNLLQKLAREIQKKLNFENLESYVATHQNEFPREFRKVYIPDKSIVFDENNYVGMAYKDYSWAACVNEIYFHADTYKLEIIKSWNVFDIGKVVNQKIAEGQAEGGILQALAYANSEFFYKKKFGRVRNFTDYTLPTTLDVPEIDVEFIHTDNKIAKGLGEIPMDFPAPAVRNAFLNATGIFVDEYPLTPENIFNIIRSKNEN